MHKNINNVNHVIKLFNKVLNEQNNNEIINKYLSNIFMSNDEFN